VKRHVLRTLILLLLPCLFLGTLAGWVVLHRGSARTAAVAAELDRDIVWPGERVRLSVTVDPRPIVNVDANLEPADVVLVLDRSGSMAGEPVGAVRDAALALVEALAGPEVHFAVVPFNEQATTAITLSDDPAALSRAIRAIEGQGDTNFLPPLERAQEILRDHGRPGARPTIVFLSDGQSNGDLSIAQRLHQSGVSIHAIGYGVAVDRDQLTKISGRPESSPDPGMYHEAPSPRDVLSLFLGVGEQIAHALMTGVVVESGTGPRALETLDTHHRFLTHADPKSGRAAWLVPVMFGRPALLQVDLKPRTAGLFRVPSEPLVINFADASVRARTVQADTRPWALFLTWPLLFCLFLPALAYPFLVLLAHLFEPPAEDSSPGAPSRAAVPRLPPTPLPKLPAEGSHRPTAVPSLLIGLGTSGRHTLTHFKDLALDTFEPSERAHVLVRQLDLRRDAYEGPMAVPVTFAGTALSDDEVCLLPRSSCDLVGLVRGDERIPGEEPWFDRARFANLPAGQLNVAGGARGDRVLARRALWRDLVKGRGTDQPSAVAKAVAEALEQVVCTEAPDSLRQVVFVFSPEEDVGGGWVHDLVHLVRSAVRARQGGDPHFSPPEVLALVVSQHGSDSPAGWPDRSQAASNAAGWFREADRLAMAGRYPMPVCVSAVGKAELEQYRLDEQGFDAKLVVDQPGPPDRCLYPAAADVLMGLVNRAIRGPLGGALRSDLLEDEVRLNRVGRTSYSAVASRSVVWHVGALVERLRLRFLQHLLSIVVCHRGEELQSIVDGSGRLKSLDRKRLLDAVQSLRSSTSAESPPEGMLSLVAEAWPDDGATLPVEAGDQSVTADAEWRAGVAASMARALTTLLDGSFGLADVAFLLKVGVGRLGERKGVAPGSRRGEFGAIVRGMAVDAELWLAALLGPASVAEPITPKDRRPGVEGIVEKAARRLAEINEGMKLRAGLAGRKFLADGEGAPGLAEERLYQTWLERWLGTPDWDAALRERVSVGVQASQTGKDPGGVVVMFSGHRQHRVSVGARDELEKAVHDFAEEWLAPLRDLSVFDKLAGADPDLRRILAECLGGADVAELFGQRRVSQRNYLALPTKPGFEGQDEGQARADLLTAVGAVREIGHHLRPVETRDLRTVRMLSAFGGGSSDDLRVWEGTASYVEGPEVFIEERWKEAHRLAPTAPPLPVHPALAVLGCAPDRFRAFAHAWGAGKVREAGRRWFLERGPGDRTGLGGDGATLVDAAYEYCLGDATLVPLHSSSDTPPALDPARVEALRKIVSTWRKGELRADAPPAAQLEILMAVYFDAVWR
jgi:uncharacterized protein YegL